MERVRLRSFNNRHSMYSHNCQLLMWSGKGGTRGLPATPTHGILVPQLNQWELCHDATHTELLLEETLKPEALLKRQPSPWQVLDMGWGYWSLRNSFGSNLAFIVIIDQNQWWIFPYWTNQSSFLRNLKQEFSLFLRLGHRHTYLGKRIPAMRLEKCRGEKQTCVRSSSWVLEL